MLNIKLEAVATPDQAVAIGQFLALASLCDNLKQLAGFSRSHGVGDSIGVSFGTNIATIFPCDRKSGKLLPGRLAVISNHP